MAAQTNSIAGSGYGSAYIDSLIWGCGWTGYTSSPITYYFGSGYLPASDSSIGAFTGDAWSNAEKTAFTMALANYTSVCNLKFTEASSASSADIVWWQAPQSAMTIGGQVMLGLHEVPDTSYPNIYGYFNYQDSSWNYLEKGQYGYISAIHELGHAFGLAHPHDGGDHADATNFPGVTNENDLGTYSMNQGIWTTMGYNDGWATNPAPGGTYSYGWQGTLMALDIAALQALYGANMNTATGNDTYMLPKVNAVGTYWSSIWDAGGTDTISNAGSSIACTINLNEAPLTGANAGGYVSWDSGIVGGFTIAHNAIIENATGGSGNDTLIGNSANNVLDGGIGNDTMIGGLGNDTYYVDNTSDVVTENLNEGSDTVYSTVNYTLGVNVENLVLTGLATINGYGNTLNNTLYGNSANNIVDGGLGNDTMIGGAGDDVYGVYDAGDVVVENSGEGTDTVWATVSYTLNSNVEILHLYGSATINGYGNALDNTLYGNSANNVLTGNAGNDIFAFNTALNSVSNVDTITDFATGADKFYLASAIFTQLASTGTLAIGSFVSGAGAVAHDANDYILYDTATGNLYYDADGNGAGAAVQFATLTGHPTLTATDVVVF